MENIQISSLNSFEHIGWKYYNQIKKKAMEQEFSWSGLCISLSIAFFIVIASSASLSFAYNALGGNGWQPNAREKFYRLENLSPQSYENYLQVEYISKEQIKVLDGLNLA